STAVEVGRRASLGGRLGGKAGEEGPEEAAGLAIRGCIRVEDVRLRCFRGLGGDSAEHLLGEHLHGPAWTERCTKNIGDGIAGRPNGISRFVRLCHWAPSSLSPLSGSNRISPLGSLLCNGKANRADPIDPLISASFYWLGWLQFSTGLGQRPE